MTPLGLNSLGIVVGGLAPCDPAGRRPSEARPPLRRSGRAERGRDKIEKCETNSRNITVMDGDGVAIGSIDGYVYRSGVHVQRL